MIHNYFLLKCQGHGKDNQRKAYLPGIEVNLDHQGGSSRARLDHCTRIELTSAIIPNVDNSFAQFLLAGNGVRAVPISHIEN